MQGETHTMAHRSRILAAGLLATASLAIGLACTIPGTSPAPTAQGGQQGTTQARPSGPQELTIGLVGIGRLSDLYDGSVQSGRNFRYMVGQTLVTLDPGVPTGQLASSFTAVNPTTWEFVLGNHRFSTGEPVTADDVVFSFERLLGGRPNPRAGEPGQAPVIPDFPLLAQSFATVDKVTATGPSTVQITTRGGPDPILPNRMQIAFILSRKAFETLPAEQAAQISAGPYRMVSFTPTQQVVLEPNPHFTGEKPILTRLTYKEIPELAGRLAALQSGELGAVENIGLQNAKSLPAPNRAHIKPADLITGFNFDMNVTEFRPREVRLGLNYALDRKAIIDAFMAGEVPAGNQLVVASTFGFNPAIPAYPFDPARARQLIAQGGYPNGFSTVLGYAPITADYKGFAEAAQAAFTAVGVRTDIELIEPAQFLPRFFAGQLPPMFVTSYSSSNFLDALEVMRFRLSVPPGNGLYKNPEFDRLYFEAVNEVDREKRLRTMQQAMQLVHDNPPGFLGWGFAEAWATGPRVQNWSQSAAQTPQFQTMFLGN